MQMVIENCDSLAKVAEFAIKSPIQFYLLVPRLQEMFRTCVGDQLDQELQLISQMNDEDAVRILKIFLQFKRPDEIKRVFLYSTKAGNSQTVGLLRDLFSLNDIHLQLGRCKSLPLNRFKLTYLQTKIARF